MFIKISLPRPPRLDRPWKITISKCTPGRWYGAFVGQTMMAEFHDGYGYWIREGGTYNAINYVLDEDVTLHPLEN